MHQCITYTNDRERERDVNWTLLSELAAYHFIISHKDNDTQQEMSVVKFGTHRTGIVILIHKTGPQNYTDLTVVCGMCCRYWWAFNTWKHSLSADWLLNLKHQTLICIIFYLLLCSRMLYGNGFREIHHHAFNGTKLDQVWVFDLLCHAQELDGKFIPL